MKPLFVAYTLCCSIALGGHQGVERWSIKTSVPKGSNLSAVRHITFQQLIDLPERPDIRAHDARYQSARIPAFNNPLGLREGDLVSVDAYVVLVGLDDGDDDYHIQLRGSPNTDPATDCVIVEVPLGRASHVSDPVMRKKF